MLTMREMYEYMIRVSESESGLWVGDLPESVAHELHQTRCVWQDGEYLLLTDLGEAVVQVRSPERHGQPLLGRGAADQAGGVNEPGPGPSESVRARRAQKEQGP